MRPVELGLSAFAIVLSLGVICGAVSMWLFRRFTDSERLRAAINLIWAHLLEFQLFASEPVIILRAQRDLIAANARFLKLIAWPLLLLALLMSLIIAAGGAIFGKAPLPVGQATVLSIQCTPATSTQILSGIHLTASRGVRVETPSVRIPSERRVCWRVRVTEPVASHIEIGAGRDVITKRIAAGYGPARAFPGFELPVRDPLIRSIEVLYPSATVLSVSWVVWFAVGTIIGVVISPRRQSVQ
jgi:hypothetical protein